MLISGGPSDPPLGGLSRCLAEGIGGRRHVRTRLKACMLAERTTGYCVSSEASALGGSRASPRPRELVSQKPEGAERNQLDHLKSSNGGWRA